MRHMNTQFRSTPNQDLQKVFTLEQSISDYRKVYPELTDKQLANRYQMRYGIKASRVLAILARMKQPTGGGAA